MNKQRIVLAEDHETVREGLKLIINAQPDMEVVGEAGNGLEAYEQVRLILPDIIVMDVSMPQLNGLKATLRIKESFPQVKILTLTRHTDSSYLEQLMSAGASGYILKQSAVTELLHAIHAVAAGGKYLDPALTGKVMSSYSRRAANLRGASAGNLSEREAEVLRLIAWGYSNKEIAAQQDISVKTVEAHKANALKKLEISSRIDIVRYAILQGWLQDN